MNNSNDEKIIESWNDNAEPWVVAVREEQIESRKLVTNQAIVAAVESVKASSVLDIGCGEGWLANLLAEKAYQVLGLDVTPQLIEVARQQGRARFEVMAYEDFSQQQIAQVFDVAVCNFSLLGKESIDGLFELLPKLISDRGHLIVQTLNPQAFANGQTVEDGWREGSWQGFSTGFSNPAPWYFRTLQSWQRLFVDSGFRLVEQLEPAHPETGEKLSLILIGQLK